MSDFPGGSARPHEDRTPTAGRKAAPGRLLFRYLLRQLLAPTLLSLVGFSLVLLAMDLLAYTDLVVNRGFAVGEVSRLALYRVLPSVARTLPFATLVGSLVALGRLGAERELLAIEASGLPVRRVVGPVLVLATLLGAVALFFALEGSPYAERVLDRALAEMARRNPSTVVQPGVVSVFGSWRLEAKEVSASGERLEGVMLRSPALGQTLFARRARLRPEPAGDLRLVLADGAVLTGGAGASLLRFGRMEQVLPRNGRPGGGENEFVAASFAEVGRVARSDPDTGRRRRALAEWHRRLALPLATLLFGLLAVPLFVWRATFSRAGGAALGIVVGTAYYVLVQLGDALLRTPSIPVALAVWLPNAVTAIVAFGLVARLDVLSVWGRGRGRGRPRRARGARRAPGVRRFILDRYVASQFAAMAALCVLALLAAYAIVDLVDNLQWFTKYGSTPAEVGRFYAARLPVLAARVVPLGLFFAAALTLNLLAVRGELVAFRACGVSTLRVEIPILALCLLLALVYYPFSNELVPRSNALASRLKQTEIKDRGAGGTLWRRLGDRVVEAELLDPLQGLARDVTLYELDADGLPRSRTDAVAARHVGAGVWHLEEPRRVVVEAGDLEDRDSTAFVELGEDVSAEVETAHLTPTELREEIEQLERSGYDSRGFRVDLQAKLAQPLACLVLPALALLYAAAGPPFPSPVHVLIVTALLAAAHLLLASLGAALGYGGAVSPGVAGWGPLAVLGLAVSGLLLRLRLRGQGL